MLSRGAAGIGRGARALGVGVRGLADGTFFSEDHEWVRVQDGKATIGVTAFAQEQLGDIVFVTLPEAGESFAKEDVFATVESVKAVSDVYSPVDGSIVQVNDALLEDPSLINSDPEGNGWFVVMELSEGADTSSLLDKDAYDEFVASQAH